MTKAEFFRILLDTVHAIQEISQSALNDYKAEFDARITGQNPQQASDYAQKELEGLKVDEQLAGLYYSTAELMSQVGDGLADDMPLVEQIADLGQRLSGRKSLSPSAMPLVADAIGKALAEDLKRTFLTDFLTRNAPNIQDYWFRQLQRNARNTQSGETEPDEEPNPGYTVTQQALALHYLLTEGMDVSGVDQTKIIALAHLLAGKKVPIRNGKENIGNSGIKTAFAKIREKHDKGRLTDLHFVLRFFKPFENTASEGMRRIVQAIETEIAKTEARLKRDEQ